MRLDDEIAEWAEAEFPTANIARKFRKLGEEIGELGEAVMYLLLEPESESALLAARHEIADCAIVLSHMATMLGEEGLYEIMGPVFSARAARGSE